MCFAVVVVVVDLIDWRVGFLLDIHSFFVVCFLTCFVCLFLCVCVCFFVCFYLYFFIGAQIGFIVGWLVGWLDGWMAHMRTGSTNVCCVGNKMN